jgi:hypothetical protein
MNLLNNIILKPEKFSRATETTDDGQRLRDCLIYEKVWQDGCLSYMVLNLGDGRLSSGRWVAKLREMGG